MQTAIQNIRDFFDRKTQHLVSVHHDPNYRQIADERRMLERACETIRMDMDAPASDNVLPAFYPDFGTVSTAAIYGGRRIPARDGGGIHIEPAARAAEDLLRLKPLPFEETDFQRALDLHCQVCDRLGTRDIFLRTPDFQGPLNTLGLLIADQAELMVAMFEQPEVVHEAARRVTDTLIDYAARFRAEAGPGRVIGNIWPYVALVDGKGVGITQDYMPLLGPEQYAEFELPQLKRISDAFGGVFIHCCGVYGQHLRALAGSGVDIIGLECVNALTPVSSLYETFGDRIFIVFNGGTPEHPTLGAFLRSLKGQPHANARFWFQLCHESQWDDPEDVRRALAELAEP